MTVTTSTERVLPVVPDDAQESDYPQFYWAVTYSEFLLLLAERDARLGSSR